MSIISRKIPSVTYSDPVKANIWPYKNIIDSYFTHKNIKFFSEIEEEINHILNDKFKDNYYFYNQNNKNTILTILKKYYDKFMIDIHDRIQRFMFLVTYWLYHCLYKFGFLSVFRSFRVLDLSEIKSLSHVFFYLYDSLIEIFF